MSIEVRQLRYAVKTADTRSFARAARAFNLKQSTLSRRVTQLEERLGIQLFERSSRGAQPTETGRAFLEVARRIVTDIDNLSITARTISYGEAGRLSVGFGSPLMGGSLRTTFAEYLSRFPDVQFDGVEAGPDELLRGLQAHIIDSAILAINISEAGIKKATLWPERIKVALPEGHSLADAERIYWSDLRREVFVLPKTGTGPVLNNLLSARLTEKGYHPNLIVQEAAHENIVSMVAVSRFITVVPESMMGVQWPGLIFKDVFDAGGQAYIDFSLYWREDNDNPALKHFLKLLKERYPSLAAA